jgi:hypothetical protein
MLLLSERVSAVNGFINHMNGLSWMVPIFVMVS